MPALSLLLGSGPVLRASDHPHELVLGGDEPDPGPDPEPLPQPAPAPAIPQAQEEGWGQPTDQGRELLLAAALGGTIPIQMTHLAISAGVVHQFQNDAAGPLAMAAFAALHQEIINAGLNRVNQLLDELEVAWLAAEGAADTWAQHRVATVGAYEAAFAARLNAALQAEAQNQGITLEALQALLPEAPAPVAAAVAGVAEEAAGAGADAAAQ